MRSQKGPATRSRKAYIDSPDDGLASRRVRSENTEATAEPPALSRTATRTPPRLRKTRRAPEQTLTSPFYTAPPSPQHLVRIAAWVGRVSGLWEHRVRACGSCVVRCTSNATSM